MLQVMALRSAAAAKRLRSQDESMSLRSDEVPLPVVKPPVAVRPSELLRAELQALEEEEAAFLAVEEAKSSWRLNVFNSGGQTEDADEDGNDGAASFGGDAMRSMKLEGNNSLDMGTPLDRTAVVKRLLRAQRSRLKSIAPGGSMVMSSVGRPGNLGSGTSATVPRARRLPPVQGAQAMVFTGSTAPPPLPRRVYYKDDDLDEADVMSSALNYVAAVQQRQDDAFIDEELKAARERRGLERWKADREQQEAQRRLEAAEYERLEAEMIARRPVKSKTDRKDTLSAPVVIPQNVVVASLRRRRRRQGGDADGLYILEDLRQAETELDRLLLEDELYSAVEREDVEAESALKEAARVEPLFDDDRDGPSSRMREAFLRRAVTRNRTRSQRGPVQVAVKEVTPAELAAAAKARAAQEEATRQREELEYAEMRTALRVRVLEECFGPDAVAQPFERAPRRVVTHDPIDVEEYIDVLAPLPVTVRVLKEAAGARQLEFERLLGSAGAAPAPSAPKADPPAAPLSLVSYGCGLEELLDGAVQCGLYPELMRRELEVEAAAEENAAMDRKEAAQMEEYREWRAKWGLATDEPDSLEGTLTPVAAAPRPTKLADAEESSTLRSGRVVLDRRNIHLATLGNLTDEIDRLRGETAFLEHDVLGSGGELAPGLAPAVSFRGRAQSFAATYGGKKPGPAPPARGVPAGAEFIDEEVVVRTRTEPIALLPLMNAVRPSDPEAASAHMDFLSRKKIPLSPFLVPPFTPQAEGPGAHSTQARSDVAPVRLRVAALNEAGALLDDTLACQARRIAQLL